MKLKKLHTTSLFTLSVILASSAQSQTIDLDVNAGVDTLAESVFNSTFGGLTIFEASFTGDNLQSGAFSTSRNIFLDDLGINSGVVLSTGSAFDAVGLSNTSDFISTKFGNAGSDFLSGITGRSTADAATLSFDFQIGENDDLFGIADFNFVFGSDEYDFSNDFGIVENNDIFSFSIDGNNVSNDLISVSEINRNNAGFGSRLFTGNFDGEIASEADGLSRLISFDNIFLESGVHTVEFAIADSGFRSDSGDSFIFFSADTQSIPNLEPTPVPELSARGASLAIIFLISILLLMSEKTTHRNGFRHPLYSN